MLTFDQAIQILDADLKVVERTQSNIETAKALVAIGEKEKALELFANTRLIVREHFSKLPMVKP